MDWITQLGVVLAVAALIFGVAMGYAVLQLRADVRRLLGDVSQRQNLQTRRLAEGLVALQREHQQALAQIQLLAEANRRLAAELAELNERVSEDQEHNRPGRNQRYLH